MSATVTEPGIYDDLANVDYHAHVDWLSSTGARKLLPPSCPARFEYERRNPPESTKAFDLGNAAHDTLLGGGPEIVTFDFPDWRTQKAKDAAAEARDRGAVPILREVREQIDAMVAAVRAHPIAGRLFDVDAGQPEASLFWIDERTGVQRRARLDLLPERTGRRLIIPDLKTARSADPEQFVRHAADYGYHQQAGYYIDAVLALDLADDPVFVFVVLEKEPPYLVSVVQLDVNAMRIGHLLNRRAIDIYAECTRTGVWPGYVDDVALVSLPVWLERRYEEDLIAS